MTRLQFNEASKQKMINQLLDHYNQYNQLYDSLGDTHFKQEAEKILHLLHKYFGNSQSTSST